MHMSTVKIENYADLKRVGAVYGIEFPARQGRPPSQKVAKALAAANVTVEPTPYFDGVVRVPAAKPVNPGPVTYVVTAFRPKVVKGVVQTYSATGKNKDKAGEVVMSNKASRHTITSTLVREFAKSKPDSTTGDQGRLSTADTVAAAALDAGWGDPALLNVVSVERVDAAATAE